MKTIRSVGQEVRVKSVAEPVAGAGQVKIRIRRTAISTGTELFKLRTAEPDQEGGLGYMAAGIVEEVRDEASGLKAGDRVFAGCSHAEYGVKDAIAVHPLPEGVDFRAGGLNLEQYMYRKDLTLISSGQPGMAPPEAHVYSRAPRLSGGARDVYPDAWYFHREIQASLEMIQSGYIRTDPVISHDIGPEEAPEIFRKLADRDRPVEILGVVVRWE